MFAASFVALSVFAAAVSAQVDIPPQTDGNYSIRPVASESLCLTAQGPDNGDVVEMLMCSAQRGDNQNWLLNGGTLSVFNGTKCLDVKDGVDADGTQLQVWDCTEGDTNQQWYFTGDQR